MAAVSAEAGAEAAETTEEEEEGPGEPSVLIRLRAVPSPPLPLAAEPPPAEAATGVPPPTLGLLKEDEEEAERGPLLLLPWGDRLATVACSVALNSLTAANRGLEKLRPPPPPLPLPRPDAGLVTL